MPAATTSLGRSLPTPPPPAQRAQRPLSNRLLPQLQRPSSSSSYSPSGSKRAAGLAPSLPVVSEGDEADGGDGGYTDAAVTKLAGKGGWIERHTGNATEVAHISARA